MVQHLHYAADNGHINIVQNLLNRGAEINATDDDGWTPLRHAEHKEQNDVVALLKSRGGK